MMDASEFRIQILDDDPNITEGLAFAFELDTGFPVVTANRPEEGLEQLREDPGILFLLTDYKMPQLDGLAYLREAKKLVPNAYRNLLTGQAGLDNVITVVNEIGLHHYFTKPVDNGQVLSVAQAAFEQTQLSRENEAIKRQISTYERRNLDRIAGMVMGVAHEINTPLGLMNTSCDNLTGMVRSLTEGGADDDPELVEDLSAACSMIQKQIHRVDGLIGRFRQLSVQQLHDTRMTADMTSLLRESIGALRKDLDARNVTVTTQWDEGQPMPWEGFPGFLSQVLGIVVSNSLTHGYKGADSGTIEVRLTPADDRYRVEVADAGVGIAADILPRVFDPFVTSERAGGTPGLGLAVAQNLVVNLLGGTIECESTLGEGTTVVLELPRRVPPTALERADRAGA